MSAPKWTRVPLDVSHFVNAVDLETGEYELQDLGIFEVEQIHDQVKAFAADGMYREAEEYADSHRRLFAAAPDMAEALRRAEQLATIASDWNLSEVEIDGEMVGIYELREEFRAALAKAQGVKP